MEPLSRNKKIGLFSLVVLSLALVGLFLTGNLSFSGLKSNVLDQSCTVQGQAAKLPQYKDTILKRDQAQKTLDIVSGEIVVLNKQITEHKDTIKKKQQQIDTKNAKIAELDKFIENKCRGNLAKSAMCKEKKQQRKDLAQDIQILKNAIKTTNNTILVYSNQIKNKKSIITRQLALIAQYTTFINAYESCDRQLNTKPILTSPLMSGEARMSGEALVSGEVCMSSEVLISGEVHISGEVNVPVYKFTVLEESPGKAEIESIDYDISQIDITTLQASEWFVAEEYASNILYECVFQDTNKTQLHCLPGAKSIVNSTTKNYILYAKVKAITGIGVFKVYGANIAYNGGKVDATNRTTTISIKYGEKPTKTEIQYVSQFGTQDANRLPYSSILDADGNIFVAMNTYIQKFDASGKLLMKFGSLGRDDGQLGIASDIAIDTVGNIYVADGDNSRVQKFDASGKFLMNFGTQGSGDGQFRSPRNIHIDNFNNIYVADPGNSRIQKFDASGKFLMKFGTQGSGDGQLIDPRDIAIDTVGNIYVSDTGNSRIQKFDASGKFLMKLGTLGSGDSQFRSPYNVTLDTVGNIYVVDQGNNRIQKFDASGKFLTKFGSYGAGNAQFQSPHNLMLDKNHNIYVVDTGNKRIQKFAQVAVCENNKPSITVLSPNGGEALELGKYLYPKPFIKYDVKNAPENSWVALSLYKNGVALGYITIGADISYNDGLDWEVGTYVDYIGGPVHKAPAGNDYTIEAMLYTGEKPVGKVPQYPAQKAITFDRSDAVFSLISSAPTCTSGSIYVANSMKPDKCCTQREIVNNMFECGALCPRESFYVINSLKPDKCCSQTEVVNNAFGCGSTPTTCIDSDGENYFKKGEVSQINFAPIIDSCDTRNTLTEMVCRPFNWKSPNGSSSCGRLDGCLDNIKYDCPNGCSNGACLPPPSLTHSWMVGPWSACVNGAQTRSVTCQNNLENIVSDSYCNAGVKPANTRSCSMLTTYTVIFYGSGATIEASPSVRIVASPATTVNTLPVAPVKTGYTFAGWYTAVNGGGTQFTTTTPVTANTTVYAKWVPFFSSN